MTGRIFGLDGLRGIAALVVLAMHTTGFAGGHLAVDFFFMLSGYVMARTYECRLRSGELSAWRFFAKRYRRLWPTMAVGASLGLAAALLTVGASSDLALTFGLALLLVPAGATVPYLLNLPAWSIFYELVANAVHGAVFARMTDRRLWLVLGIAAALFAASFAVTGFPRILRVTSLEMQAVVVFRVVVSYVIGILLYRRLRDRPPIRIPFAAGAIALPAYAGLVALEPFFLWPLPFIFVVAPLMIVAGLDESAPKRVSAVLGDLSFPLYAIHFPIMALVALAGGGPVWLVWLASLAVASLWLVRWPRREPAMARAAIPS